MKKRIALFLALMACIITGAKAQNMACLGLKNPTNFTLTGGEGRTQWTGYIGSKAAQASTCNNIPLFNGSTTVAASQLATQVTTQGSSCRGGLSRNYANQPDNSNRFVIKGRGFDPETQNRLTYTPAVYTNGTSYTLDSSYTSSIRLGNYCGYGEAEALTYQLYVTPNNALVTLWFAMSLENGQHNAAQNPEFAILVEKQNGSSWTHIGGDTLCYVQPSPLSSTDHDLSVAGGYNFYFAETGTHSYTGYTYGVNVYLPWKKVIIDLYKYLYQTIRLKISAGDCSMTAHYACSYVAGECQPMALVANGCAAGSTEQVAEVKAPKGLIAYQWYRSKTGVLSGIARNADSSYVPIPGATDSILQVNVPHFINAYNGDTLNQTTIKCEMQSLMNQNQPDKRVTSKLYTNVGSMKPTLSIDTNMNCDNNVQVRDISEVRFTNDDDNNKVDTSFSIWSFYETPTPTGAPAFVDTAGISNYTFENEGEHCVTLRTHSFVTEGSRRTCWNEKTVNIRSRGRIRPVYDIERDNICFGDTIWMKDLSQNAIFHEWHIFDSVGQLDTTIVTDTNIIYWTFWRNTTVQLRTHSEVGYRADTTGTGELVTLYCDSTVTFVVHAQDYPVFTLDGDTVVCIGSEAIIHVNTTATDCTFDWYHTKGTGTPFMTGMTMRHAPQADKWYYVKVTNQNGCFSWDSLHISVVDPKLTVPVTEICKGHSATLTGTQASYFTWTANPPDASLAGQDSLNEITVTPQVTTTYNMIGHGLNGCNSPILSKTITVYPYPVIAFEMSPNFVDSEDPNISFSDVSQYGVASRWDFESDGSQTGREIVHTFSNISNDSIQVRLTSYNQLNCSSDTSFYVPVHRFSLWFPNAITPTLPMNNTFGVITENVLEHYSMFIYNRGGELVFYSTDQNAKWDGKFKGKYCTEGVYIYSCTYRRPNTTDIVTRKGNVILIR